MPKIIENIQETILAVAKNIVVQESYEMLTMRRVSEESGIAVGTVYNYFPTKKDLMYHLLEDYWYEYLKVIDDIHENETGFYIKMKMINFHLGRFVDDFLGIWLKNSRPGYDQNGLDRKDLFTEKVIRKIEEIVALAVQEGEIKLPLPSYEISRYIFMNMLMISQMKQFDYESFEKILKKLFIYGGVGNEE